MAEVVQVETANRYRRLVYKAVESLLDEGISQKEMENSCSYLDVQSFADVTEERAVLKLCGYPPCTETLQEKTWPKYRIRGKKVFDTTERRRFCSDLCYERYIHVSKQLPDVPLWFRGMSDRFRLSFLENETKTNRGLPGREIDLLSSDFARTLHLNETKQDTPSHTETVDYAPKECEEADTESNFIEPENIAISLADLIYDDAEDSQSDDSDDYQLVEHIDCEDSALGKWRPLASGQKRDKEKFTSKGGSTGPKLIDPLPLILKKKSDNVKISQDVQK